MWERHTPPGGALHTGENATLRPSGRPAAWEHVPSASMLREHFLPEFSALLFSDICSYI